MGGTVAFFAWAYNQPTDFDLFVEAQKEFIDDLYDGKLLTDFSQQSKDDIDLVKRPSWAELAAEEIKSRQEEEEAEKIQEMHRKNLQGERPGLRPGRRGRGGGLDDGSIIG